MKKIKLYKLPVLLLLFFSCVTSLISQTPAFSWVNQFGLNSGKKAKSITVDNSGDCYVIGTFDANTDFDPGPGTFIITNPTGNQYAYIVKLNSNGGFIWAKSFATQSFVTPTDIEIDNNGNVYVLGTFDGTTDFDPAPANYTLTPLGSVDLFITKLDNSGNFIWTHQIGGPSAELLTYKTLEVDNVGNIYFAGSLYGTVDFDVSVSTNTLVDNGGYDIFACKLSSSGNFLWAKSVGGSFDDEAFALDIDNQKNVIIGGNFGSIVDFDPGVGVTSFTAQGNYECFLLKLDSVGVFQWVNTIGNSSTFVEAIRGIAVAANGDVCAAGTFSGTVDFDPSPATNTLSSNSGDINAGDIFIAKFNSNGNITWAKMLTGAGVCELNGMDVDFMGNIYTTGSFNDLLDLDPSAVTATVNATSGSGIFVSKLSPTGNYSWGRAMVGLSSGYEEGEAIKIDFNGNIFTTGNFNETVDFDPDAGVTQLNNTGNLESYVHKFNQCITPLPPNNITPTANLLLCQPITTTTLSALSNGTVSWFSLPTGGSILSTGLNFITPTLSVGSHTFYAAVSTCTTSTTRTAITLSVFPGATITAVSSASIVCAGESVTLTSTGGSTYTWLPVGSGSSIVVTPTTTTVYNVNATDLNGCLATTSITQNVNPCLGLFEKSKNLLQVKIYPNPSKEFINIESEINFKTLFIKDILGRELIKVNNHSQNIFRLSTTDLLSGAYLITLVNEDVTITYKFIKE